MKRGLGAALEASFRPSVHWGAEFLADRVRICGMKPGPEGPSLEASFEGPYAEASAFAEARGLAFHGLHGAVSHIPFKLEAADETGPAGDEDASQVAERYRPIGLPPDSMEVQGFLSAAGRRLLLAREEAVRGFAEHLPAPLAALWDLVPSPLALLPHAAPAEGRLAALVIESAHAHILFLRDGAPEAYAKSFSGWEDAVRDPGAFARGLRKILVYHLAAKFPGAALEGFAVWCDGPGGEGAAALESLGIRRVPVSWPAFLDKVPAPFKAAAAMAALEAGAGEPSFSVARPAVPERRRLWMRRTGMLARAAYPVMAALAAAVLLLAASALIFRHVVQSKAQAWSGELKKWDTFQERRAAVEGRLHSLEGLLSRRTAGYASLQRIASLLPSEVWLEEWEAECGPGGRFVHRIAGYSLAEDRVPQFLAKLEDKGRFRSVKLKSTERIKGDKVEKETGIQANRKDLVRFQLVVSE